MVTMSSFDALIAEHAQRTAHVDRMGWLMQAASASTAQPRRRPGNAARPAGVVALVASLLAAFFR